MARGFELVVVGADARKFSLSGRPLYIGRSPSAEIAVADDRVSWEHARVWIDADAVKIADLGSRNGTRVQGERVIGTTEIPEGSTIDIAGALSLTLRVTPGVDSHPGNPLVVEETQTRLRFPFRSSTFTMSAHPSADLRLEAVHTPIVLKRAESGLWLTSPHGALPLQLDMPFVVGGVELVLKRASPVPKSTVGDGAQRLLPYRITASLDPPSARVWSPSGTELCAFTGDVQATLVWVLAHGLHTDGSLAESERGWMDDRNVIIRVWGRGGLEKGGNRLKVSLHRLRTALREAGVDTTLLERRPGQLRLRAARVEVADA